MKITINGEVKSIDSKNLQISLTNLIQDLEYNPLLIVVELNGSILNRSLWESTILNDGDTIEIVTIIGGGS